MFEHLRENRALLMGLAILGIGFYHAPFDISSEYLWIFHSSLNMGVDLFLFFSGLGACHSLKNRGGKGYLSQRARRLLPGLYPFLLLWCAVMGALGAMTAVEFLGNVTFFGWWFGAGHQLNWYFSGVWLFFLTAPLFYRLFLKARHPLVLWLLLVTASFGFAMVWPWDYHLTVLARLPIFLTGMLFGRLEQTGFRRQRLLKGICYALLPVGLFLVFITNAGYGWVYGYSLGLWWYPYALVIPGGAILVSELAHILRRWALAGKALRPLEALGQSSSEALMVHMGVYKVIFETTSFHNRVWVVIWLLTMAGGVLYRRLVNHAGRVFNRPLPRRRTPPSSEPPPSESQK